MSVDDQLAERLAEWLHDAAPEPPRLLSAADIQRDRTATGRPARVTRGAARRRIWFPVLAAACVVLAAVLAVTLSSGSGRRSQPGSPRPTPPSHSAPSNSSPSISSSPTPSPSEPFAGLPAIWRRQVIPIRIAPLPLGPSALTTDATLAYVRQPTSDGRERLLAIDPRTGGVVARAVLPPLQIAARIAVAGGRVWVPQSRPAALQWWNRNTLVQEGSVALGGGPITDVTARGTLVYVGQPGRVSVIDSATAHIVHRFPVAASGPEPSTRLSVSPDGTRLYVGTNSGSGWWSLAVLNPQSGALLADPVRPGGTGVGTLLATDGGVWVTQAYGMSADLRFFSSRALAASGSVSGRLVEPGSGTLPLGAWLVDRTVFTTSPTEVACRVPDTAGVRAARTTHGKQYYTDFGRVNGQLLALWQPNTIHSRGRVYLVRLTPPAACR